MTEIGGVDFAWGKPDPVATRNCGYTFVMGYLSGGGTKDLTAAHVQAYRAAGLNVGLVWETSATRVQGGAAAGAADGAAAEAEANTVGYPTNCVIFFAVDFAATTADFPAIQAYAQAFNNATRRPIGIYGSFNVVEHFVGTAGIQYGWQTAAWSAGNFSAKAHLYQRAAHTNWPLIPGIDPANYDEDVQCLPLPLFGEVAPTPTPPPPPPPNLEDDMAGRFVTGGTQAPWFVTDGLFKRPVAPGEQNTLLANELAAKYTDGSTVKVVDPAWLASLPLAQNPPQPQPQPAPAPVTLDAATIGALKDAIVNDPAFQAVVQQAAAAVTTALDADLAQRFSTPPQT